MGIARHSHVVFDVRVFDLNLSNLLTTDCMYQSCRRNLVTSLNIPIKLLNTIFLAALDKLTTSCQIITGVYKLFYTDVCLQ